ncbi:thioredoxin [Candidatus Uhrbacteria bacterium CG10_big_fil_rev_8_21_14_0_10_50_16]|uniref:Thioredoxin n=1 Tax=Candidatus Uhrbacteria bacterium CG10_big_fil_rev_8_21_14_0_10_50_16 TaxID=1975039 RepID=A0A2H0RM12_9BACT|nr:MAG: thioredoxin [Candidatus Uhrbacteria bacterium CG10_big_fil_rev_8_21_14_0_10_50_16]
MALELTTQNFDEQVTNAEGVVVVDFWAPWCGPCKMMSPVVEELAEEMGNVTIAKVNVDENQEVSMQFNVLSIPTFIIFKGGQVVDQFAGAMGKDALKARVEKHL